MAMKPSDRWCVSLCRDHHAEQHRIGEKTFWRLTFRDPIELANEFARKSPHWSKLREMQ